MSIELVSPSNHLILCHLELPSQKVTLAWEWAIQQTQHSLLQMLGWALGSKDEMGLVPILDLNLRWKGVTC